MVIGGFIPSTVTKRSGVVTGEGARRADEGLFFPDFFYTALNELSKKILLFFGKSVCAIYELTF